VVAVAFCRVYFVSLTLPKCARNGTLFAGDPMTATVSPCADYTAAALPDAGNLNPTPTVTSASGTDANGNSSVEVTVACPFQTIPSFPGPRVP
jgi:hypothetical protein